MKSVYIHIPFCKKICNYCDFPKILYSIANVEKYFDALEREIKIEYNGKQIKSLYIGGGTPSVLSVKELKRLNVIIKKINLSPESEITFELNPEDITKEKLELLKKMKVNRLSIGIQTFNEKSLIKLGRNKLDQIEEKITLARQLGFININLDLMYGFAEQTLKELKKNLEKVINLKPTHISIYSLILEPHTMFYINKQLSIDEVLEKSMDNEVILKLATENYHRYEFSNFAKEGYQSNHNNNYWDNNNYYGFGLGAHGYIDDIRYENTRSFSKYLNGDYRLKEHLLSKEETIENELILGFRKSIGINVEDFFLKYQIKIETTEKIKKILEEEYLILKDGFLFINPKVWHLMNEILIKII